MPDFIEILKNRIESLSRFNPGSHYVKENLIAPWLEAHQSNTYQLNALKPAGNPFSAERSACLSIIIGLLLESNMSLEDIFDPKAGRSKKDEIAADVMAHMFARDEQNQWIPDYQWVSRMLHRAGRALANAFDTLSLSVDYTDVTGTYSPKNAYLFSLGNCCYDIYQELCRNRPGTNDIAIKEYLENDYADLTARTSLIGKFSASVEKGMDGILGVKEGAAPGLAFSQYIMGELSLRQLKTGLANDSLASPVDIHGEVSQNLYIFQALLGATHLYPLALTIEQDPEIRDALAYALAAGLITSENIIDEGPMDDVNRSVKVMVGDVDIAADPDHAKSALINLELNDMGLTLQDVVKIAGRDGVMEYINRIRSENLAAIYRDCPDPMGLPTEEAEEMPEVLSRDSFSEAPGNISEEEDIIPGSNAGQEANANNGVREFRTLGDVERFLEIPEKSTEDLIRAFRALNTISEASAGNEYREYQAGELLNKVGAAIGRNQRQSQSEEPLFTPEDVARAQSTMNRHFSAARKMQSRTTLTEEQSSEILSEVLPGNPSI